MFLGFRNMNHASNQYVCKSQYKFGDAFRMAQLEVGGRLLPEHPLRDQTSCYQELQKTCGNYVAGGGLLDRSNYFNIPNPLAQAPYCPQPNVAAMYADPHSEPDQVFVLGFNFERSLGSGLLSGLSLKTAGYSIHCNIDMTTTDAANTRLQPNGGLLTEPMQMLAVLHHDKSIVLRGDSISVAD